MSKGLVLIVEDESDIADLIDFHLTREGFRTKVTASGRDALDIVRRDKPDLVMLDIMLPDVDGLEVCRKFKQDPATRDTPVIMVSARGEESDVVVGLELGADDYVTKPFSHRVLIARVKVVLRRSEAEPRADGAILLADGELVIDSNRHVVRVKGELVEVTLTEYKLLEYLASRPGFVRTRDQIVSVVRGEGTVLSSRAIDVHVASLRRKLGDFGSIIETVRGVGYRLADGETIDAS